MNLLDAKIRIEKMVNSVERIGIDEVKKQSDLISELNRKQLSKGQKADGSDMPRYVTGSKAPKAPGRIQLDDTGAYQKGIAPQFQNRGFKLSSSDEKIEFLPMKYPYHLGLTNDSQDQLIKVIIPRIISRIKRV